ncbi:Dynein beta chain, ciliary, partial [Orchesella cincta]
VCSIVARRTRKCWGERPNLTILFDKYVPTVIDMFKTRFKRITPMPEITHIQVLCNLLECLLPVSKNNMVDHRADFSKWFQQEFKFVKFPQGGSVFDFYIDNETKRCCRGLRSTKFELDPDIPLQATIVHTSETIRIKYLSTCLWKRGSPQCSLEQPEVEKTF